MAALTSALTHQQGRENTAIGIHAGCNIGDGNTGFRLLVGRTCDGQEACFALDQQIVSLTVTIGTIRPIAGNITNDKVRTVRPQRLR